MLEIGPTYKLIESVAASKLDADGNLMSQTDPLLPPGTRFTVINWNEWGPDYSEKLKESGLNGNFYEIRLEASIYGSTKYLVLAHRLEQDSQLAESLPKTKTP